MHIADVSHFIRPGNALDEESARRGTTVYLCEKVTFCMESFFLCDSEVGFFIAFLFLVPNLYNTIKMMQVIISKLSVY